MFLNMALRIRCNPLFFIFFIAPFVFIPESLKPSFSILKISDFVHFWTQTDTDTHMCKIIFVCKIFIKSIPDSVSYPNAWVFFYLNFEIFYQRKSHATLPMPFIADFLLSCPSLEGHFSNCTNAHLKCEYLGSFTLSGNTALSCGNNRKSSH